MAWQYPKYTCGHGGERYQVYGKMDGRARQLAAIEAYPCPECRKIEAEQQALAAGLPLLVGSPKQIAWASEIRERKLRLADQEMAAKLRPEASAKWWIEHR